MTEPTQIIDTPLKKRKLDNGNSQPSQHGYDSANDSGSDLFEGIDHDSMANTTQFPPSLPPFVTQPTQLLLDDSTTQKDHTPLIQVAASSPERQVVERPKPPKPVTARSLSTSMAPAGTEFRRPFGVQTARPKPMIIDISDESGPKYEGDSSDEDELHATTDIRPSTFTKSKKSLLEKTLMQEPSQPSGIARFKEITSSAMHKPQHRPKSHSLYVSQQDDRQAKSMKQRVPQKPQPIMDIDINDIDDFSTRNKIESMRSVLPSLSVSMCKEALIRARGNESDALDLLTSGDGEPSLAPIDLTRSDDEDEMQTQSPSQPKKTTAKRQVKLPTQKIKDKYGASRALPSLSSSQSEVRELIKPSKRLVKGRKHDPLSPVTTPVKDSGKAIEIVKVSDDRKVQVSRNHSDLSASDDDSNSEVGSDVSEGDIERAVKVLDFFNKASVKDIVETACITESIADTILSHRQKPFKDLNEIRNITIESQTVTRTGRKKTTTKNIGDRAVDVCLDMSSGYEAVDALVSKCDTLGQSIAKDVEKWDVDLFGISKNDEGSIVNLNTLSPNDRNKKSSRDSGIGTPSSSSPSPEDSDITSLRSTKRSTQYVGKPQMMADSIDLKDYQLAGLNWLSILWKKRLSCILADEMGLGKTCQVISFLSHLYEIGTRGLHLVIVPGSTLENWLREFKMFSPKLPVEPYYGLQKEREEIRQKIMDNKKNICAIVTTYDIAQNKLDRSFLAKLQPKVCVFDEGHVLKNSKSKRYHELMRISAEFRLLLTGTPLQNNLQELTSLLGFILPDVFYEQQEKLDMIFKYKAKTSDDTHEALLSNQRVSRAKSMMGPFVLRRKKQQVLKHLPKKTRRVEKCEMTPSQQEFYRSKINDLRLALQSKASSTEKKNKGIGSPMMVLRQAAIHPMLFRYLFNDLTVAKMAKACLKEAEFRQSEEELVYEDMGVMSDFELYRFCEDYPTTMSPYQLPGSPWLDSGKVQILISLLLQYKENGDRALIFSQFKIVLNILETVLDTHEIGYHRLDGSTKIDERQDMIDQFYADDTITAFLLSTKAGGAGINLACANKVIIFDCSFNPQDDVQAENRAHRVGQTRDVEVVRLISTGTIEEEIYRLGQSKLMLDDRVAGEPLEEDGEVVGAKVEKQAEEMITKLLLNESSSGK